MATAVIFRGKAAVEGIVGAFDAILYALQQNGTINQAWDEEDVKDVHGYDVAWLFRNEHGMAEFMLLLVGDTAAHSIVPITAAGTTTVSNLGQPFATPGSTLTLSTFLMTAFNGVYQFMPGCSCELLNTAIAKLHFKGRKYADSTQTTAIAVTPS